MASMSRVSAGYARDWSPDPVMSSLNGLNDIPTRALIEALLSQPQIRVRKRWAQLQIQLWQEQGWVESLAEPELFRLLPAGRRHLAAAVLEHELRARPDAEASLQQLGLELPAQCHHKVLASLLKGSREHSWSASELAHMREQGIEPTHDGLLRLRANIPFSLFFRDGDILDTGQLLALSGELCLPDAALGRLQKLLWQGEPPERIVTVDNRAAYVAMPMRRGQLVLLAPPGHTRLCEQFISSLTPNFHWVHHTDLHPKAILRAQAFAERLSRSLVLLLPPRLSEIVGCYGRALSSGECWDGAGLSGELLQQLAPLVEQGMWLEQESTVLFC